MVFILSCLVLLGLFIPRILTSLYAYPRTYAVADAPELPVAIVFGAGLRRDGSPTAVLRDRVMKGVELYLSGKVSKLLMSGDNLSIYYDEPSAMKNYAVSLGVPESDIVLDYAGLRTYDTCYRARSIFGVRQAILVTQDFHLPRALYTCNALGIEAVGVAADGYAYRPVSLAYWNLRETIATFVAVLDVHVTRPIPVMGQPQPIFPPEI
ncbi:MAG: vancomycin high temperature exclusion protein [Anaerolineales bacterium]